MKHPAKRIKKLVKGKSASVLVSLAIHGVLLFLATGWVIFTIIEKKEQKFVPQEIKRPQMKLKKLRVRVKESVKPRKAVERITSSGRTTAMPDIQLPELGQMGHSLKLGVSGFEMMADLSQMTLLGGGQSVGNDLEGTFYDLKRLRDGSPAEGISTSVSTFPPRFLDVLREFFESDWNPSAFSRFYRAPQKLYATQLFIPSVQSRMAPPMFGVGDDIEPALWVIHYKGNIAHKTGGTFRFSGFGDDIFVVRINGKVVLDATYPDHRYYIREILGWQSDSPDDNTRVIGGGASRIGDWFTLEPGVPVEMEALVSEVPGGTFQMTLLVEEKGRQYPENERGDPILPIFKTIPMPQHLLDELTYLLAPGQADLTGGPVFGVY